MTFKDIFPGLSRTLSINFQDFPGPAIFKKKLQDCPGGVGTLEMYSNHSTLRSCLRRYCSTCSAIENSGLRDRRPASNSSWYFITFTWHTNTQQAMKG